MARHQVTRMRIDVFTIFPEYLEPALRCSIVGRARDAGLLDARLHDVRDYTEDKHRSVDDAPFGGGAGMVMMPGPLFAAVSRFTLDSLSLATALPEEQSL